MLKILTTPDIRKMNDGILRDLEIALDSGRDWSGLYNILTNLISLHGQHRTDGTHAHCQAYWHGLAHEMDEWCPQPSCDSPMDFFIAGEDGEEGSEWEAWRSERLDGRSPQATRTESRPTRESAVAPTFTTTTTTTTCTCRDGAAGLGHEDNCNLITRGVKRWGENYGSQRHERPSRPSTPLRQRD